MMIELISQDGLERVTSGHTARPHTAALLGNGGQQHHVRLCAIITWLPART